MLAKSYANDGRQWFILTCEPNKERIAAAHLIARGFVRDGTSSKPFGYLPTETRVKDYKIRSLFGIGHRQRHTVEPIFRGMIFLRFGFDRDGDKRDRLKSCPGIHNFLRIGADYAVLSDIDIDEIQRIEYDLAMPPQPGSIACQFQKGDRVRVDDGFASDWIGTFKSFDAKKRIVWLETRFGRLRVPASHCEAA